MSESLTVRYTPMHLGLSLPIPTSRYSLSAYMLMCWIWPLRTATSMDDSLHRRTLLAASVMPLGKETLGTKLQLYCEKRAGWTAVIARQRSSLESLSQDFVRSMAISTPVSSE